MRFKNCLKLCGILSLSSVALFTGCATTPSDEASNGSNVSINDAPDQSQPNSPLAPVVALGEPKAEPEQQPMKGTVASVLKKIETNQFSLYWREKNSYTYFIGDELDAEYKLNEKSLMVRDRAGEQGLVCVYDESGALRKTEGISADKPEAKDACSKLMFTLDDDMSD